MASEQELTAAAWAARENAVADFSRFRVGAALETTAGKIFAGCNIENATYGLTVCAERVALWKALSEGHRSLRRLVVAADTDHPTPPCGACRQLLWEFCGDIPILLVNRRGQRETVQLRDLLPRPFDRSFLNRSTTEESR